MSNDNLEHEDIDSELDQRAAVITALRAFGSLLETYPTIQTDWISNLTVAELPEALEAIEAVIVNTVETIAELKK
jgi:ADP-heptose:LPS heptosyltransferase